MLIDRERDRGVIPCDRRWTLSVILVGSKVGKTAILAGVAELMVEERVPRFCKINVSCAFRFHLCLRCYPSEAQERLLMVLSEVAKSRNIILAITDVDQLVSDSGGNDLASTLVDFLARSGTFAIATTTPQAYSGC